MFGFGDLGMLGFGDLVMLGFGDFVMLGFGDFNMLGFGDLDMLGLGDLDMLGLVRTIRWNRIGHFNTRDNKRKGVRLYINNLQGSRLRGRPENRWWNCVKTDIDIRESKTWKDSL